MIQIQSMGQLPVNGTDREGIIQEAVSHALEISGMFVYPSGVWNVGEATLQRVSDRAYNAAREAGTRQGYEFSYAEMRDAVLSRGYKVSTINPFTRQPITISRPEVLPITVPLAPAIQPPPPQPVIILPARSPALRRVTVPVLPLSPIGVRPALPEPITIRTMSQQPVIRIPAPAGEEETAPRSKSGLLIAAAAVLILSRSA